MIYLLFYDTNYGDREEWNTFYTPIEAFSSAEEREKRKDQIRKLAEYNDYEFHEMEIEMDKING